MWVKIEYNLRLERNKSFMQIWQYFKTIYIDSSY